MIWIVRLDARGERFFAVAAYAKSNEPFACGYGRTSAEAISAARRSS